MTTTGSSSGGGRGLNRELLGLYFNDHLAGATAGIGRMKRMKRDYVDTPFRANLERIARELAQEREVYRDLISRHRLRRRRIRQALAWVAERLGRLKLNGRAVRRSPMTPVIETELMRAAILGKIGGWQVLGAYREELGLSQTVVDELVAQAHRQIDDLGEMHEWARERAFRGR